MEARPSRNLDQFNEEEEETEAKKQLEVEVLKTPPRMMTAASSSEPSGVSRHDHDEEEEEEEESTHKTILPIPEIPDNPQEDLGDLGENIEEEEEEETSAFIPDLYEESPIIEISEMKITSPEEARHIAEIILKVLEQDLFELKKQGKYRILFPKRYLSDPILEKGRRKKYIKDHYSKASLVSNLSELNFDLEEPSTLVLTCDIEESLHGPSLYKLPDAFKADVSTQVDQHRDPGVPEPLEYQDNFCQTKEFTILRRDMAHKEFIKLYPRPDDWHEPAIPSRNNSLQKMLDEAGVHDPRHDIPPVGPKPKYKKPLAERMLKPICGDYQKEETYWTGSTFKGSFKNNMFDLGHYVYPTLAKYESEFREGHIHSRKHFGLVTYPRGDTFEGTWRKGRFTDGKITFSDGLTFEPIGWRYCTPPDRRFFSEKTYGVKGVGETTFSDRIPPPRIPYACYDVGDGIYQNGQIVNYEGVFLRKPSQYEHNWIVLNCRKRKPMMECYEPLFMQERPPDFYVESHSYPKNT